jgi:DNA-binding beta-propeller fold protein YncE
MEPEAVTETGGKPLGLAENRRRLDARRPGVLSAVRTRPQLAAIAALLAIVGGVVFVSTRSQASLRTPTVARAVWHAAIAEHGARHFEYVFPDGQMFVYDIDHGFRLVQRVTLPDNDGVRGVAFSPGTGVLYVSHGGDGGGNGNGSLLAYRLVSNKVLWNRSYPFGIDSMAVNPSGTRIYMPDGELSSDGTWAVLEATTGTVLARIDTGVGTGDNGPHNTIVGLSGRYVYLGDRDLEAAGANYLYVASTATDRVIRRIGPLRSGVRPFTINGRETIAYTTATGFLGFQTSSISTGRVLYTSSFGPRFRYDPSSFAPSAPSHGISLTPNERDLWVLDGPNSYLHVFDVSQVPRLAPRRVADVKLPHRLVGDEADCAYDCTRDGWLQISRDGCFVFVGDTGDVVDTRTDRPVAFLPAMHETRKMIEIDWRDGRPIATTTRIGLGYVTRRPLPPAACS